MSKEKTTLCLKVKKNLFYNNLGENGAAGETRTPDLMITNQLLYQLSYDGI